MEIIFSGEGKTGREKAVIESLFLNIGQQVGKVLNDPCVSEGGRGFGAKRSQISAPHNNGSNR